MHGREVALFLRQNCVLLFS